MAASPSLSEIASSLASTPLPSRGSSRVLCLILQTTSLNDRWQAVHLPQKKTAAKTATATIASTPTSGTDTAKTKNDKRLVRVSRPRSRRALAEAFLRFSPRVQFREPNLIFIDIASTAHLFRRMTDETATPESGVLEAAVQLACELGYNVKAAISDTTAGAQVLAQLNQNLICRPGEERERLQPLPLPLLLHLEGLIPWKKPRSIEQIAAFFYMLGMEKVGDLDRFSLTAFQERWGETGALLWRRLRGLDYQVVSPLLPTESLEEYVHLDFPLSLASLLLHYIQRSLRFLLARLHGRCLFARRFVLRLYCEYSGNRHVIHVEPNTPSRNLDLFLTLIENKLDGVDLENPIREFEIEVIPCPERAHQLDFFEPRTTDTDKLESLFSLLQQSAIRSGLYEIDDAVFPERNWRVRTDSGVRAGPGLDNTNERNHTRLTSTGSTDESQASTGAFQALPEYGLTVMNAPRPTRLLKKPRQLPLHELQRLHVLTEQPIERLEGSWWEQTERRDYYFAISPSGQCLWIFQDLETQIYYLHGYFD